MACHELAALRLGLMEVIGIEDPHEKEHDIAELGESINNPGPLQSLTTSANLETLARFFGHALTELQEKVSRTDKDDKNRHYYNSLLVLTKKVEQDLQNQIDQMKKLYGDLDEIHHFLHELYPAD